MAMAGSCDSGNAEINAEEFLNAAHGRPRGPCARRGGPAQRLRFRRHERGVPGIHWHNRRADAVGRVCQAQSGLRPHLQTMALGDGLAQRVKEYTPGFKQFVLGLADRSVVINRDGVRAWRDGVRCIWRREGVWGVEQGGQRAVLLKPSHFDPAAGSPAPDAAV